MSKTQVVVLVLSTAFMLHGKDRGWKRSFWKWLALYMAIGGTICISFLMFVVADISN